MIFTGELDTYIIDAWNEIHSQSTVTEEAVWNMCRELEEHGLATGDECAVSTRSIGPFKIATKLDVDKKSILKFWVESVIPSLICANAGLSFDQFYTLYLLPASRLLIKFVCNTVIIKDDVAWKVLIYIKNENNQNRYPTLKVILSNDFKCSDQIVRQAIERLISEEHSIAGTKCSLIEEHTNGGFESKV